MADSFSDLLQQILPVLQGVAQSQPQVVAGQTAAHVATPVVQPVLDLASALGQAGAGTAVGPLLAPDLPPAARRSPAGAAGFQTGRAIGALLSGAGPGGLAQVAQQGQAEWQQPEPFPGYKGVFEAPFNPLSYVGMPQGKAAGALAEAGGPLGRVAGGLARGNEAWQGAVSNAIQRATDVIGAGVRKLPAAVGETSVRSAKAAEGAAAQDVAQRFGRLADQSIAPPEARNAVRYLAGEETARQFAAPPAAGDLLTAGRPSDFDAALGIDRAAGAPTRGALDQIQAEVIDQYTRRARHDIDIARTAYKALGLPEDAPLSTVIAQADAAAPPILDAIPEAQRLYQEAHPGQPVWNDSDFNSFLQEAEHNVAAASPGVIDDNAAHWSTVLHWLQDTYGDLALNQRGAAAAAARRLTRERGAAPLHPAAESLGLTPGTSEPAATAPAPPEGIPLGKAQIDPTLLQQNLDAGMPMAEARAKAVVNTEGGIPPVPPAGPASSPPEAGPAATTPAWVQSEIDRMAGNADRLGISQRIEDLSAQRLTAQQVAQRLTTETPGMDPRDVAGMVRAVRAQRGIPNMDDATAFEAWLQQRAPGAGPLDLRAPAATGGAEGVPPSAPPVEASLPPGGGAPGIGGGAALSEAVGPSGRPYQFQYRVVDLQDLVPSHTDAFTPNPAYPAGLQPRQRDRGLAQLQVGKMARDLRPEPLLMPSPELDRGPMIVAPDLTVESGNGRVLALRQAAAQYPEVAQSYQDALAQHLPDYGLSTADLAGKRFPVLVRERVTPLSDVERVAFAAEANQRTTLGMGAAEQALSDAQSLPAEALSGLDVRPGQSLAQALQTPTNRPFVRQFMGRLPPTEQASLMDAQGQLSQAGLERVGSALFARVYDGDVGQKLTYAFRESLDPTISNLQRALEDTLPAFARLKGTEFDLASDLAPAVDVLARLRQEGLPVAQYLGQGTLFERELTPFQEQLLTFLDANLRNRARLRDTLSTYASQAAAVPPPEQLGLFGAAPRPTKGDLLDRAATATTGAQGDLFSSAEAATAPAPAAPRELGPAPAPVAPAPAAPDAALAGAETVAPPGAPAGPAPAAAPGAPATQFDTAGNVVAGEAVPPPGSPPAPAGMSPEMAAGFTPAELARVAGLDPELVARMQASAPRIVSQFDKDRTAFQNLQARLAVVGEPPPTIRAAQAALKTAQQQGALQPTETKQADTLLRGMAARYPTDTPLLDPAAEAPALFQSWLYERGQQLAAGSRLTDLPKWATIPAQGWNWAMNAMRMLEVLSGMQPAKHIADAYLHRVGFAGEAGIPDMGANLWQALRTGQEAGLGPASAEWYASHGLSPPAALTKSAYAADIGTALEPAGTSAAGQGPGTRLRTYLKNVTDALARTASDTARNGGFMTAFDETAAKAAPQLAQQLTGILGDAGAPVAERVVAAQGIVTPGQLSEWMQAAGAVPAAAKEALFALGDFQRTASQAGMALADKMAPGAVTLTNLDEALRYAIPFHTFATRQAPRTLELFLTNPKIWELFDAYHRAAQEENQQAGILPGTRLSQRVPVFELAGQKVYLNPLDYFAEDRPFKQPFNSPKQSPLIGEPYQRLSQQGLGLAGPLGLLLNATGALGPAPPPELTPVDALLSNALSTVAGQQITMPWQGLGNARLSNTPLGAPPGSIGAGVDAFDPTLEVRKRLAEKSMEDTGRVNDPRYVAAMANPADPLYQAAAREVNGRELLQELVRMIGLPIGLQNRAEGAIGQGMAGLPMVNAAGGAPGQWTMPTIPYANAQGPLVTYADRERMLLDRARTAPAALGYSAAYSTGAPAEGAAPSSAYSQFADQVRKDWQSGSMAQRNAILLDPRKRGVILADQIQHAPLFRLPGASGGGGRAPLQDILPITP